MNTSLVVLSGPFEGQVFELTTAPVVLGRGGESSWRLPDPAVSRRHCRIEPLGDGRFEVIDLGSRAGIRINGRPVKRGLLEKGDLLALGQTSLFVAARSPGEVELPGSQLPEASTYFSTLLEKGQKARLLAPRVAEKPLLGEHPALLRVSAIIDKVAPTPATVLILGESGSGKEVAARCLHAGSPRAEKNFVAINCASLSENLLESELFGHEKGAFTGAVERKIGKLEVAAGGTLFLDEIGEMPMLVQARLLRVLQERCYERVGGTRSIEVDVRILAATHRDLEQEVRAGRFREDLFYRLKVITLRMPSLRERIEDLPQLAAHFAARHGEALRGKKVTITPAAMAALQAHSWPGNVRELANAIESAVVLGSGECIEPEDLPEAVFAARQQAPAPAPEAPALLSTADAITAGFQAAVGRFKKALLQQTLEAKGGNVTRAAEALGLHPNHLHRLLTSFEVR